jgi:hypothetical protein
MCADAPGGGGCASQKVPRPQDEPLTKWPRPKAVPSARTNGGRPSVGSYFAPTGLLGLTRTCLVATAARRG